MPLSASVQPTATPIMELAPLQGGEEALGLTLPEELLDPEMLKAMANLGCLKGEAKQYTFCETQSTLPQKLTDYLSDVNRPQQKKTIDHKGAEHHLSFKESLIKEKTFKTLEPHTQHFKDGSKDKDVSHERPTFVKANQTAKETLEKAKTPKSLSQLKETAALKQQHAQAKTLEQRVQREFGQHETPRSKAEPEKNKTSETRKHSRESDRETKESHLQRGEKNLEKNEERDQQKKQQKREEEEGFADGGKNSNQQNHDREDDETFKTGRVENSVRQELESYGAQDSILSEIFKMRISQFDVLILFIEILKIQIRSREQERLARRQEREQQIMHMQNIVENFQAQGKWMRTASIGAGMLAIVAGLCPIVGHVGGKWILEKLGGLISALRDADPDKAFEGFGKMFMAGSEMQKSYSQIQQSFSEASRTYDQTMSDLRSKDGEENTRAIDEIKDTWKGIENFLYQTLQMHHDAIRQLYSQN